MTETSRQDAGALLRAYDRVLIAISGGADSTAIILLALESGVDPARIELHHHDVDGVEGGAPTFMDWPCTRPWVRKLADQLGLSLHVSWREGGIKRETEKRNAQSGPVCYAPPGEAARRYVNPRAPFRTRTYLPEKSADLRVRWCSGFAKVDCLRQIVTNEPRFLHSKTIVLTGERAEESPARARYRDWQIFQGDRRDSPRLRRHVDHWRPILHWTRRDVWAALERWKILPHPAYRLGFSRTSCRTCIFLNPSSWATVRTFWPSAFSQIVEKEAASGRTITNGVPLPMVAARGTPHLSAINNSDLVREADDPAWDGPIFTDIWQLPAGAYGPNDGPS